MKRATAPLMVLIVFAAGFVRAEDQFFESGSTRIRYTIEGMGEPVILIHGLGSNFEDNFGALIKPLVDTHQVIGLDTRGHGKSAKPADPKMYGLEMDNDVIRLMDHLRIEKAHLVGYSMGAYIAYGVMLADPERVLSVTLAAGGGIPPAGLDELQKKVFSSKEFSQNVGQIAKEIRQAVPLLKQFLLPNMPPLTEPQIRLLNQLVGGRLADDEVKTVATLVKDLDPNALLTMIGKLGDEDVMAIMALLQGTSEPNALYSKEEMDTKLSTSSIPILGIAGTNDPSRENLENLQKRLQELKVESRLTLVLIDKANHLNTPGRTEFVKAIQDFLKAHPAR